MTKARLKAEAQGGPGILAVAGTHAEHPVGTWTRDMPQAGSRSFPAFFQVLQAMERCYERASRQTPRPIYPSGEFAWTRELEAAWPEILSELRVVLKDRGLIPAFHEISPEQRAITRDQSWKTYVLHAYGARANHNCRACPRTAAAVERIPGMKTAFFSILAGGKHIPAHRGPYKGLLRCHLGLIVPSPDARAAFAWVIPSRTGRKAGHSSSMTRSRTKCGTTAWRIESCCSSISAGRCVRRSPGSMSS